MTPSSDRTYLVAAVVAGVSLLVLILLARDLGGAMPILPRFTAVPAPAGAGPTNPRAKCSRPPPDRWRPPQSPARLQPRSFAAATAAREKDAQGQADLSRFSKPPPGRNAPVNVGGATTVLSSAPVVSDLMISNVSAAQLTCAAR